ncbi:MAG: NfeD family protein [Bacteroidales bacterium]|nr:NfeD family protein [Bacteroidales bacterium]
MIEKIFTNPELFWFIIGLVLFILELITPGFFFLFFGLGAWVAALVSLIGNPDSVTNLQMIIFGVTSVITLIAFRKLLRKKFLEGKSDLSEAVEDEFTGKEAVATEDFDSEKKGKVDFKGTTWKSESNSVITKGQTVIILKKDNFKLFVEPKN